MTCLYPNFATTESHAVLHGQSPSQLSPGPQQIDDLGSDGRCQAVPIRDQLVECRTLPAHFRPGFSHHVVTALRADHCGTRASGAIPAASTFVCHKSMYRKNLCLSGTRVGFPPPPVFWHAGDGTANDGRCTGTALCIDSALVVCIARGAAKWPATSEVQAFCRTLGVNQVPQFRTAMSPPPSCGCRSRYRTRRTSWIGNPRGRRSE